MFLFFPFGLRNPVFLLIFPCVLAAGVYRERLRKRYNADVTHFGSLTYVSFAADDFDSRLVDCFKAPDGIGLCLFALFCYPVRLGVNASATGCNDFWFTIIMAVFLLPFFPILGYILRMHIREMFNMNRKPVADFFAWVCCYCLALSQESRFLNHGFRAIQQGTPIVFVPTPNPRVR